MFGFLAKNKTMLGLDIGTYAIKAVEMSYEGGRMAVSNCAYAEVPGSTAQLEVLKNLVNENKLKGLPTVSSLSGRSVIVRYVPMPKMSLPELKKAIRFEAGKYIPFGLDEYTVDCEIVHPGSDAESQMKVVLVAVKSSQIAEHVELIKAAGLSPRVVDIDCFALCNVAADSFGSNLGSGNVLSVLDFGQTKTNVGILNGLDSFFTREFYLGGADLTEQLSNQMAVDPYEIEKIKREPGEHLEELTKATATVVDDMANEIRLSFDFFENEVERRIDSVHIAGGTSYFQPLASALSEALDVPVSPWNPLEGIEVTGSGPGVDLLKANPASFAIALGLAGRVMPEKDKADPTRGQADLPPQPEAEPAEPVEVKVMAEPEPVGMDAPLDDDQPPSAGSGYGPLDVPLDEDDD